MSSLDNVGFTTQWKESGTHRVSACKIRSFLFLIMQLFSVIINRFYRNNGLTWPMSFEECVSRLKLQFNAMFLWSQIPPQIYNSSCRYMLHLPLHVLSPCFFSVLGSCSRKSFEINCWNVVCFMAHKGLWESILYRIWDIYTGSICISCS